MKIGDIYKNKDNNSIIQIDSFATHMGRLSNGKLFIIFKKIEKHNEFEIGSCPSSNGYGTQGEIENEYKLVVPQDELNKYSDWNEIFQLINS